MKKLIIAGILTAAAIANPAFAVSAVTFAMGAPFAK